MKCVNVVQFLIPLDKKKMIQQFKRFVSCDMLTKMWNFIFQENTMNNM